MLREASHLLGEAIDACDGRLGVVEDLYFDDQTWLVRYALVRTGVPFRREHLLIEPGAIAKPEWPSRRLDVWLSRREARGQAAADEAEAPPLLHLPSPEHQQHRRVHAQMLEDARRLAPDGSHLRSVRDGMTYRLSARDGSAGRVRDFVLDDSTWAVTHVAVDVQLFIGSKPVLVPPQFIEAVDPMGCAVRATLSRHALGGAPRFQSLALMSRLYQMCVFDYYNSASGTPLMRPARGRHVTNVDAGMLLSTLVDG